MNWSIISRVVMAMPIARPPMLHHGCVCHWLSAHKPSAVPPKVGTNILHVVSAIVPSNKITVEVVSGGFGLPDAESSVVLMYTNYSTRNQRKTLYAAPQFIHKTHTFSIRGAVYA